MTGVLQVKAHTHNNHRQLSYHDNGFCDTIITLSILIMQGQYFFVCLFVCVFVFLDMLLEPFSLCDWCGAKYIIKKLQPTRTQHLALECSTDKQYRYLASYDSSCSCTLLYHTMFPSWLSLMILALVMSLYQPAQCLIHGIQVFWWHVSIIYYVAKDLTTFGPSFMDA